MEPTRRGVKEGMVVLAADGEKLGKVVRCDEEGFIVEKGIFFPRDYIARYEDVADVRGDEIYLRSRLADLRDAESREGASREGESREAGSRPRAGVKEQVSVPVVEEELIAEKRSKEAGAVHLRKEVRTERKNISVPVTREEVRVERVPAGREVRPGEATFQENEVTIPIREEEVEVRKRPVVREEVRVSKTPRQEERVASAEVRKERAEVEEEGRIERTDDEGPDYHA